MNYSRIFTTGVNFAKKNKKDKNPGAVFGNAVPAALPPMQPTPNLPEQRPFYPGPMPQSQTYIVPPVPEEDKGPTLGGALLKAGGATLLGGTVGLGAGVLAAPHITRKWVDTFAPLYSLGRNTVQELAAQAGDATNSQLAREAVSSLDPESLTHLGGMFGIPIGMGIGAGVLGGIGSLAKSAYDKWGRK